MPIEENIKVLIRIRPNNNIAGKDYLSRYKDSNSIIIPSEFEPKRFTFDKVANENTSQEEIFQNFRSLFESFFSGYNCTIFAYGQTGSGKTYTMTGDSCYNCLGQNPGLVPQGLEYIFDKINDHSITDQVEYLVKCSFVEIYNEQLFDLLDPKGQKVQLKDNFLQGVYVDNLTEKILNNTSEALEILQKGLESRHVGSTAMNRESSRSHAVFSIILESSVKEDGLENIRKSVLHLVDLAGSERQKDTKSDGVRLKEAGSINKSLHVLGQVISAHVDIANGKVRYIRYRESKLTHLLKDSIGGNSKTFLVACVHPDIKYTSETISTLQFASNVKLIRNKAKINIDVCGNIESLQKEVLFLREQLENSNIHYSIKSTEYDYDSIWRKRFIHVMGLRMCLTNEICQLKEQLGLCYTTQLRQQDIIQNLKDESQMKEHKIQRMQNSLLKSDEKDEEIKKSIDSVLSRIKQDVEMNSDKVKLQIYQTELSNLRAQLHKVQTMQSLGISEAAILQTLYKDYNEMISSGDIANEINNINGNKVEVSKLQEELAEAKITIIKQKIKNGELITNFQEERRKLESEIASLRLVMNDNNFEKEKTAKKRRQTLLHIISHKSLSPIKFAPEIKNDRKKSKLSNNLSKVGELNDIGEDFQSSPELEFEMLTTELKEVQSKNSEYQSQVGKLEYEKKEYLKDIEKLTNFLKNKEELENSFNELKEKFTILEIELQELREINKKSDFQMKELTLEKEKQAKSSNSKIQSLQVELEDVLLERDFLKDEFEVVKSSLELLKSEYLGKSDSFLSMTTGFESNTDCTFQKNTKINEELISLNKEICEANETILSLKEVESENLAEICELKKRLLYQENEMRKLENDLVMAEEGKLLEISKISNDYKSEIHQLESQKNFLKERNGEMDNNLFTMKLDLNQKLQEIEDLKEKKRLLEAFNLDQSQRYAMVEELLITNDELEREKIDINNIKASLENIFLITGISIDLMEFNSLTFSESIKQLEAKLVLYKNDIESYREMISEANKRAAKQNDYIYELSSQLQLAIEQRKSLKMQNEKLIQSTEQRNSKQQIMRLNSKREILNSRNENIFLNEKSVDSNGC